MSELRFLGLNDVRYQGIALSMVRLGNTQVWPIAPTGWTITDYGGNGGGFPGDGVLDSPKPAKITRSGKTFTIPTSQFDVILNGYDLAQPTITLVHGFSTLQIGDQVECFFYNETFPYAANRVVKFTIT